MAAVARALLFGAVVCAAVMAAAAAEDGEAAAVVVGQAKCGDCTRKNMKDEDVGEAAAAVVGQAKCGDCTRKNMKDEDVFKGLQVVIKCKNGDGESESKAVGDLDGDGAFSVPLAADDIHGLATDDLHGADCFAQLHSATSSRPCSGQEPSEIVPLSTDDGGKSNTFVVVAGKMQYSTYSSSAECTSAFLCDFFRKHPFFDYFHKKPEPKPDPKPMPSPENGGGAGNGGAQIGGGAAPPSPSSLVYH